MVTKVTAPDIVDKSTSGAGAAVLINDIKRAANQLADAKEPDLGVPPVNDWVLASSTGKVRKWVDMTGEGIKFKLDNALGGTSWRTPVPLTDAGIVDATTAKGVVSGEQLKLAAETHAPPEHTSTPDELANYSTVVGLMSPADTKAIVDGNKQLTASQISKINGLKSAAFLDTGTASGQLPDNSDLDNIYGLGRLGRKITDLSTSTYASGSFVKIDEATLNRPEGMGRAVGWYKVDKYTSYNSVSGVLHLVVTEGTKKGVTFTRVLTGSVWEDWIVGGGPEVTQAFDGDLAVFPLPLEGSVKLSIPFFEVYNTLPAFGTIKMKLRLSIRYWINGTAVSYVVKDYTNNTATDLFLINQMSDSGAFKGSMDISVYKRRQYQSNGTSYTEFVSINVEKALMRELINTSVSEPVGEYLVQGSPNTPTFTGATTPTSIELVLEDVSGEGQGYFRGVAHFKDIVA